MPNTPCQVGQMAAGLCRGEKATKADVDTVLELLKPTGTCVEVANEELIHAVTGLSGSGPAYVFMIIEAMADGGVKSGLPRNVAMELATQTVLGSAMMVAKTKKHPGELKDQVCSPGGTTIAGVSVLEAKAVRGALIECVYAATQRSKELSKV